LEYLKACVLNKAVLRLLVAAGVRDAAILECGAIEEHGHGCIHPATSLGENPLFLEAVDNNIIIIQSFFTIVNVVVVLSNPLILNQPFPEEKRATECVCVDSIECDSDVMCDDSDENRRLWIYFQRMVVAPRKSVALTDDAKLTD
jgi:acyl-CoA hydrolase